jgi:D-xylose transport system substrate-binding protein
MKRRLWALVAVIGLLIAACGGDEEGGDTTEAGADTTAAGVTTTAAEATTTAAEGEATTTAAAGEGFVVGISWNNFNEPRWAKFDQPAIIAAVEANGGTVVERNANDSAEQQLTDVSSLIGEGVDVLIILAKDTEGILPAVQEAEDAGIPVIGYDRLIPDEYAFYLSFNNVGVGTIMAEEITQVVTEGNYAIVKGHSGDPNATFLRNGMTPVLDEFPGIEVVCEDFNEDWDPENAQNMMTACLAANENNIQAVISENDNMAGGVVAALAEQGLDGNDNVPVTGQDGDEAAIKRVALQTQLVSVWKDSFVLGTLGGNVASQLAQGAALDAITAPSDLPSHTGAESPAAVEFPSIFPDGTEGPMVWSIILKPTPIKADNIGLIFDNNVWAKEDICAAEVDTAAVPDCS